MAIKKQFKSPLHLLLGNRFSQHNLTKVLGAFPRLFPYGIGGIMDINRRVQLTYIENTLIISSTRG
jgi:hypothetical protein